MFFALFLLGYAAEYEELFENGWGKKLRKAVKKVTKPVEKATKKVTKPVEKATKKVTKEVSKAVHDKKESIETPPITIGAVTAFKQKTSFRMSSISSAAQTLKGYGFDQSEIEKKFKKVQLANEFTFETSSFSMDIHSTQKCKRTSRMVYAIVKGKKSNGITTINVERVDAKTSVESKIIKKKSSKTLGVKTSSKTVNEFRPLVPAELQQIYDKLDAAIKSKK